MARDRAIRFILLGIMCAEIAGHYAHSFLLILPMTIILGSFIAWLFVWLEEEEKR